LIKSYKIILAEDHLRFRQVTKKVIEENDALAVVGEAADGLELLELLGQLLPDHAAMRAWATGDQWQLWP
jgi:DNA-binding NarL/FixJ family response regulator